MLGEVWIKMNRFGEAEERAVLEVLRSGELSSFHRSFLGGKKVIEFEKAFAEYHDIKHAISTTSGTTALHAALLACGIKEGDEVITTPYTFAVTSASIVMCGAKPVYADIDSRTYALDSFNIEGAITERTKAILPVHNLGHPADMDPILEIAEKRNLRVVEDTCQALGAEYNKRKAGTIGHLGCFSLQDSKVISTGEGGMVITNDDELARRLREIRNHGDIYGSGEILGYNYRMGELQAAIGIEQLKKLDLLNVGQVINFEHLAPRLPNCIMPPFVEPYAKPTFYIIGCTFDESDAGISRGDFIQRCTDEGLHEGKPRSCISGGYKCVTYNLPFYKRFKHSCPNAEELVRKALWLDVVRFPNERNDMDRLIEGFEAILK